MCKIKLINQETRFTGKCCLSLLRNAWCIFGDIYSNEWKTVQTVISTRETNETYDAATSSPSQHSCHHNKAETTPVGARMQTMDSNTSKNICIHNIKIADGSAWWQKKIDDALRWTRKAICYVHDKHTQPPTTNLMSSNLNHFHTCFSIHIYFKPYLLYI